MGCYAEAVWTLLPGIGEEPDLPKDTGWVVLTAGHPSPGLVRRSFRSPNRVLVITGPGSNAASDDGVSFAEFEAGPPPRLSDAARGAAANGYGAAVLLDGIEATSGRVLADLARAGVGRVAWRSLDGWHVTSIHRAVLRKPLARLEKSMSHTRLGGWYRKRISRARAHLALKRRNAQTFAGQREWAEHRSRVGIRRRSRTGSRLTVTLYIGQLNSGGAERQCVNLAIALGRLGHRVRVLTSYPMSDENAHYCDDLRRAGIRFGVAGGRQAPGVVEKLRELAIHPDLAGSLPDVIRNPVFDLAGELLAEPPDVLHCWLDYPNIIGAAAGVLVGTPHVVLSTRNVNPTYFPAFYQSWMDHWYEALAPLPQMHLLANSTQGAADYAEWLDIPRERFEVIYNGVDLASMTDPEPEDVAAVREQLALDDGQPLVVGVFRMAQEKQPLLWLDVIERVRKRIPNVRAALVGVGDLREEVEERIASRKLGRTVTLLGQRKDVPAVLAAADVKLLTSKVEGTPNVILEAQWAGCPPVATAGGGTPDALVHGVTGVLTDITDAEALAAGVVSLLQDPVLREEMARAGRAFVRERFSVSRMVSAHLAYYESLIGPVPPGVNGERAEQHDDFLAGAAGP
jgi:glycosyltransferase involved in cell wall biosynthesis